MKRNTLILFAGLLLLVSGCKKNTKDNACFEYVPVPAEEVQGPLTALAGEDVRIHVTFTCVNGCGSFGYFRTEYSSTTLQKIAVIARYETCGGCLTTALRYTQTYSFRPVTPGTYTLQFSQGNNKPLTHTISVY